MCWVFDFWGQWVHPFLFRWHRSFPWSRLISAFLPINMRVNYYALRENIILLRTYLDPLTPWFSFQFLLKWCFALSSNCQQYRSLVNDTISQKWGKLTLSPLVIDFNDFIYNDRILESGFEGLLDNVWVVSYKQLMSEHVKGISGIVIPVSVLSKLISMGIYLINNLLYKISNNLVW